MKFTVRTERCMHTGPTTMLTNGDKKKLEQGRRRINCEWLFQSAGGAVSFNDMSDLIEEDVMWSTMKGDDNYSEDVKNENKNWYDYDYDYEWSSTPKQDGSSLPRVMHRQFITPEVSHPSPGSAPISVPTDWGNILRVDSADDPDSDDGEWMPPHEYLARGNITGGVATSLFEGVGRTLKGRDLSRVRNAVWQQTGFIS